MCVCVCVCVLIPPALNSLEKEPNLNLKVRHDFYGIQARVWSFGLSWLGYQHVIWLVRIHRFKILFPSKNAGFPQLFLALILFSNCIPTSEKGFHSFCSKFHCVCSEAQSCLTLGDPMDCSLPGCSIHGILQARKMEWVAIPSPGDLSDPGIEPASLISLALAGRFFTTSTTWEISVYLFEKQVILIFKYKHI